jgi:UDP:flavonoid glycosyltransferase YjiC (YdhE family)
VLALGKPVAGGVVPPISMLQALARKRHRF